MEIRLPIVLQGGIYTVHSKIEGFLQRMVNRLAFGYYRYGPPDPRQDYLSRLKRAVERYEETGNLEFLVDAANYCLLETAMPLHPNAHFKSTDSQGSAVKRDT
jgi:hypothetical protein